MIDRGSWRDLERERTSIRLRKGFAADVRRAETPQHCDVVVLQASISMLRVEEIVSMYHMDLPDHHILCLPHSRCGVLLALNADQSCTVLALHHATPQSDRICNANRHQQLVATSQE